LVAEKFENVQNKTTELFSVGNTRFYSNDASSDFLYLLRDEMNKAYG